MISKCMKNGLLYYSNAKKEGDPGHGFGSKSLEHGRSRKDNGILPFFRRRYNYFHHIKLRSIMCMLINDKSNMP